MSRSNTVHFSQGERGSALAVRVIPNAPRTQIAAIMDDGTIKIKVAAPPVEGKANTVLITYLAKILQVAESQIEVVAGQKSRNKLITVLNISTQVANQRIQDALQ